MSELQFRECGECYACCNGHLLAKSHGNTFGGGCACVFLVDKMCSVYETRPDVCRKYQCAWTQHLLDIDMRPDKCGLMVSVEIDQNKKQYFKAMQLREFVGYEVYKKLDECAKKLNTYWIKVK
jgi:Fe-S-cluster containining protein